MAKRNLYDRCWIVISVSKRQAKMLQQMIKSKSVPKAEVYFLPQEKTYVLVTDKYKTLQEIHKSVPEDLQIHLQPYLEEFSNSANLLYKPWPKLGGKGKKTGRRSVEPTLISVPKRPNTATFGGMHKRKDTTLEGGRGDGN